MPNATQVGILDKDGNPQTVSTMDALIALVGTLGDAAWASGNGTLIGLMKAVAGNANSTVPSSVMVSLQGKPIAASASSFVLGATGATGDTLEGILIQPTGTTVGVVTIYDNANLMYTYPGGTVGAHLQPGPEQSIRPRRVFLRI